MYFAQTGDDDGVVYGVNEEIPEEGLIKIEDYYRFNPLSYAGGIYSKAMNSLYLGRESWGAREPIISSGRSFIPYLMINKLSTQDEKDREAIPDLNKVLFGIAIHHAGNSGLDSMREIQDEHIDDTERADIGYHFGISLSGRIYEGRYIGVKGSHLTQYNTGIIGIVFLADFDHDYFWDYNGDNEITHESLVSAINLIKSLKEQFPNIETLGGHNEWKNNVGERRCPGDYGIKYVRALRSRLELKSPRQSGHG